MQAIGRMYDFIAAAMRGFTNHDLGASGTSRGGEQKKGGRGCPLLNLTPAGLLEVVVHTHRDHVR